MASKHLLCLQLPAQDTAPGHHSPGQDLGAHKLGGTLGSAGCWTRGMEHHHLQGQGREVAGCSSHLEKVERLCKSETRRGLAKSVVFWC